MKKKISLSVIVFLLFAFESAFCQVDIHYWVGTLLGKNVTDLEVKKVNDIDWVLGKYSSEDKTYIFVLAPDYGSGKTYPEYGEGSRKGSPVLFKIQVSGHTVQPVSISNQKDIIYNYRNANGWPVGCLVKFNESENTYNDPVCNTGWTMRDVSGKYLGADILMEGELELTMSNNINPNIPFRANISTSYYRATLVRLSSLGTQSGIGFSQRLELCFPAAKPQFGSGPFLSSSLSKIVTDAQGELIYVAGDSYGFKNFSAFGPNIHAADQYAIPFLFLPSDNSKKLDYLQLLSASNKTDAMVFDKVKSNFSVGYTLGATPATILDANANGEMVGMFFNDHKSQGFYTNTDCKINEWKELFGDKADQSFENLRPGVSVKPNAIASHFDYNYIVGSYVVVSNEPQKSTQNKAFIYDAHGLQCQNNELTTKKFELMYSWCQKWGLINTEKYIDLTNGYDISENGYILADALDKDKKRRSLLISVRPCESVSALNAASNIRMEKLGKTGIKDGAYEKRDNIIHHHYNQVKKIAGDNASYLDVALSDVNPADIPFLNLSRYFQPNNNMGFLLKEKVSYGPAQNITPLLATNKEKHYKNRADFRIVSDNLSQIRYLTTSRNSQYYGDSPLYMSAVGYKLVVNVWADLEYGYGDRLEIELIPGKNNDGTDNQNMVGKIKYVLANSLNANDIYTEQTFERPFMGISSQAGFTTLVIDLSEIASNNEMYKDFRVALNFKSNSCVSGEGIIIKDMCIIPITSFALGLYYDKIFKDIDRKPYYRFQPKSSMQSQLVNDFLASGNYSSGNFLAFQQTFNQNVAREEAMQRGTVHATTTNLSEIPVTGNSTIQILEKIYNAPSATRAGSDVLTQKNLVRNTNNTKPTAKGTNVAGAVASIIASVAITQVAKLFEPKISEINYQGIFSVQYNKSIQILPAVEKSYFTTERCVGCDRDQVVLKNTDSYVRNQVLYKNFSTWMALADEQSVAAYYSFLDLILYKNLTAAQIAESDNWFVLKGINVFSSPEIAPETKVLNYIVYAHPDVSYRVGETENAISKLLFETALYHRKVYARVYLYDALTGQYYLVKGNNTSDIITNYHDLWEALTQTNSLAYYRVRDYENMDLTKLRLVNEHLERDRKTLLTNLKNKNINKMFPITAIEVETQAEEDSETDQQKLPCAGHVTILNIPTIKNVNEEFDAEVSSSSHQMYSVGVDPAVVIKPGKNVASNISSSSQGGIPESQAIQGIGNTRPMSIITGPIFGNWNGIEKVHFHDQKPIDITYNSAYTFVNGYYIKRANYGRLYAAGIKRVFSHPFLSVNNIVIDHQYTDNNNLYSVVPAYGAFDFRLCFTDAQKKEYHDDITMHLAPVHFSKIGANGKMQVMQSNPLTFVNGFDPKRNVILFVPGSPKNGMMWGPLLTGSGLASRNNQPVVGPKYKMEDLIFHKLPDPNDANHRAYQQFEHWSQAREGFDMYMYTAYPYLETNIQGLTTHAAKDNIEGYTMEAPINYPFLDELTGNRIQVQPTNSSGISPIGSLMAIYRKANLLPHEIPNITKPLKEVDFDNLLPLFEVMSKENALKTIAIYASDVSCRRVLHALYKIYRQKAQATGSTDNPYPNIMLMVGLIEPDMSTLLNTGSEQVSLRNVISYFKQLKSDITIFSARFNQEATTSVASNQLYENTHFLDFSNLNIFLPKASELDNFGLKVFHFLGCKGEPILYKPGPEVQNKDNNKLLQAPNTYLPKDEQDFQYEAFLGPCCSQKEYFQKSYRFAAWSKYQKTFNGLIRSIDFFKYLSAEQGTYSLPELGFEIVSPILNEDTEKLKKGIQKK